MAYRNAVFVVTEEHTCPVYSVGDEFRVRELMVHISHGKVPCLSLLAELAQILSADPQTGKAARQKPGSGKFECGGCQGIIRFETKKTGEFATLQMQLLAAAERRELLRRTDQAFALMRDLPIFIELDDEELHAFCSTGEIRHYEKEQAVVGRGDAADRLYILLSGRVRMEDAQDRAGTELLPGDIFGEPSLVAGTVHAASYRSLETSVLLVLTVRQFKTFLGKHPALHVFFYRQLIRRAETRLSHLDGMGASLNGNLSDLLVVDLCQLINVGQKTGTIELSFEDGSRGEVVFNQGELVTARTGDLKGKEAFFSLIGRDKGSFNFINGLTPEEEKLPILGGFMGLVMEGMQRLDEQDH